jgi:hypothetical protein
LDPYRQGYFVLFLSNPVSQFNTSEKFSFHLLSCSSGIVNKLPSLFRTGRFLSKPFFDNILVMLYNSFSHLPEQQLVMLSVPPSVVEKFCPMDGSVTPMS